MHVFPHIYSPVEFLFDLEKIYIKTYYISLERENFISFPMVGCVKFFHFGQKNFIARLVEGGIGVINRKLANLIKSKF